MLLFALNIRIYYYCVTIVYYGFIRAFVLNIRIYYGVTEVYYGLLDLFP